MLKRVLLLVFCLMIVSSVFAKVGQSTISLGLGYFMPAESDWDFENSAQYGLEWEYGFTDNLSGVMGYSVSNTTTESFFEHETIPGIGKIDGDFKTLILAAKYIFSPTEKFSPYIIGGITSSKVDLTLPNNIEAEAKKNGFLIGLGFENNISDKVKLGIQLEHSTGKDHIKVGGTSVNLKLGLKL